ncbi:MAG: T9SS type A sorting domain-containing protein [Phaeodactylibacter sp.]|nr:T9SS type A sorting domain-containing protein [Phaeodactylibacter sp.]MCB9302080.1 T9SS type A sorting domain-containing protein [Lewinellaceae bacterium]
MHKYVLLALSFLLAFAVKQGALQQGGGMIVESRFRSCNPDTVAPIIIYPAQGLVAQLNPCDDSRSAVFFFDISASDECDPSPQIDISIDASAGSSLYLDNPFGSTYIALAGPGNYALAITATDASGNTRQEDFSIEVVQDAPSPANAACNDTVIVNLGANCQRLVVADMILEGSLGCLLNEQFRIQIEDNNPANGSILDGAGFFPYQIQPGQPLPVQGFQSVFSPSAWLSHVDLSGQVQFTAASDSLLMEGSSSSAFAAAVLPFGYNGGLSFHWGAANLGSGSFSGMILDASGGLVTAFSTQTLPSGQVNLPVEAGYRLVLYLESADGGNANALPRAWLTNWAFNFEPLNITGLPACWGVIDARDAAPPALICPDNTDMAILDTEVQLLSGELEASDPLINTALYSCLIQNFAVSGDRYYELIAFEVSQADIYTFILNADFDTGDGDMALFQGSFNPDQPCSNILAQADFPQPANPLGGGFSDPFIRVNLPLRPGQVYYLLTTTDTPGAQGAYEYVVLSDSTGQITGFPFATLSIAYPLFCQDYGLILNEEESLAWTGAPEAPDNCSTATVIFDDVLEQAGDCSDAVLSRTFTATDAAGNSVSCVQQITFRRPTVDDVTLPPFTAPIECDEPFPLDEFGNPSPEMTGFPFLLTASGIIDLRDSYCNLGATYQDGPLIDICPLSYKFIRSWSLVDWCDPTSNISFNQVIKVGDFTAPEASCPLVDLTGDGFPDSLIYPTGPFDCTAAFGVPLPIVSDNCSPVFITTEIVTDQSTVLFDNNGQPIDTVWETVVLATILPNAPNRFVADIPVGCHRFRFIVKDECNNTAAIECGFCVEDQINPTAICDDNIHANLGAQGNLRLFAGNINEGSNDNCGIASLQVRRKVSLDPDCNSVASYFTPWGDFIDFDCCDAGREVVVELKVVDTAGNEDICTDTLLVEDKLKPDCVPPPAINIYCDELPYDFDPLDTIQLQAVLGSAVAEDNCLGWAEELPPAVNLDGCGIGTIVRRFRAIDAFGNVSDGSCQQLATILSRHNYEIRFPKDAGANCGYPSADTIGVSELGCDLLAVSVEDLILSASGDECYKIFRTYRVINWCEYDGNSASVLISRDEDCDGLPGDEDVWVLRRAGQTYIDRDNQEGNANPAAGERGAICPANPEGYWRTAISNGYWEYRQNLKVYDTIPPQIIYLAPPPFCSVDGENCWAEVEYPFIVTDNCTPDDLEFTVTYDENADGTADYIIDDIFGTYPKWKIKGFFPIGSHTFEIVARDGCGNVSAASLPFEVVDCLSPSPACINGLAAVLNPVPPGTDVDGDGDIDFGATTVFAADFVASPAPDCLEPVRYSINRAGELPDPDQDALILTCEDLGVLIVEIYAWDAAGNPYAVQPDGSVGGPNYDYCETFVLVQNNLANCGDSLGIVAGIVEREDDMPVEGVDVRLSGDQSFNTQTPAGGLYNFSSLQMGYDYTITPSMDGDDQRGLSTYDIVLIGKHILGTQLLDSPYKLIAADVNHSGSVSTLDMIQLRQLILSIILEFPENTSWRFVPRAYVFPNPANPWLEPFPEVININNLAGPHLNEDFVAIKIGDIDLSADVNNLQGVENRENAASLLLWGEDAWLDPGEEQELTLRADLSGILGMQGALQADPTSVELLGVEGRLFQNWNFNQQNKEEGRLLFSWDANPAVEGEQQLLSIRLRARKPVQLSDAIQFDGALLSAEAYDEYGRRRGLALSLDNRAGQLFQNYPNPFTRQTIIPFQLQQASSVRLEVFDCHGRQVALFEGDYPMGQNQFLLSRKALPGAGVYVYRLEAEGQTWVRRMLVLD